MPQPETDFTYINQVSHWSQDKPFMIECFATWCGPCRQQAPHLAEMTKKYGDKCFIVSVSHEDAEEIKKFMKDVVSTQNYNIATDTKSVAQKIMADHKQEGIPHAFVFDAAQQLIWHGHPAQCENHIRKAIGADGFVGKGRIL